MKRFLYWIWLAERLGAGSNFVVPLLEKFGDPETIYECDHDELMTWKGELPPTVLEALLDKNLESSYKIEAYCAKKKIGILPFGTKDYPKLLTNLKNPPIILYAKGNIGILDGRVGIGVVGTRSLSDYGRKTAYRFGYELASAGAVVVSGLALGIDSVAACGALDAGGRTVAVLGSGVEHIYPAAHKKLAAEIAAKGLLLSEYSPLTPPAKWTFPMRNRIISGLCEGTLVIEADEYSGALITARNAVLQGRDLYALPGNVGDKGSDGTNALIKNGASAVTTAADILENYRYLYRGVIDLSAVGKESARALLTPGKLSAHGVDEGSGNDKTKEDDKKESVLSRVLHSVKSVRGDTVRDLSGETEYPVFEEPPQMTKGGALTDAPDDEKGRQKENIGTSDAYGDLDESYRRVLDAMPVGEPVGLDEMCRKGFDTGTLMVAFTMLEIRGFISSVPGGLYKRR